jgi:cytidylate kinase
MACGVSTIAIDGPVAAGKTVVGRELAGRLGFSFLDTGVMYRAITWLALTNGTSIDDPDSLGELAVANPVQMISKDSSRVRVGGNEVGQELREPQVETNVSAVSAVSPVRRAMVAQQRDLAAQGEIVITGRDIGTVVLPDADLKVYLSASPENRARRRWKEMEERGQVTEFEKVLEETRRRDGIDSGRDDSPLRAAGDAWTLDTELLTIAQVVDRIIEEVQRRQ